MMDIGKEKEVNRKKKKGRWDISCEIGGKKENKEKTSNGRHSQQKRKSTRHLARRPSKKKKKKKTDTQNKHTKLLGNTCRPTCLRVSSSNSPLHHPSSGVSVTAIISPAWKSNSSSIVAE